MSQNNNGLWTEATRRKYILYGAPKFSTSIIMGFADFGLFTLYALAYKIDPTLVAVGQGLGKLTIAASQFLLGWISDAKYTRWGRRKPFLLFLTPILSISFIFLLMPGLLIDITDISMVYIWFLIWYQIFNISYALTTPFSAWLVEQFKSKDRPKASQYENTFGFFGTAVMAVFSMVVLSDFRDKIQANPSVIPSEYFISVIIFGILPLILYYLAFFLMPTEPHFKIESNLIENLKIILRNKNYIRVNLMYGFASMGWTIVGSQILPFITYVIGFSDTTNIIASGIFVIGILFFLYMWRKLVLGKGKKKSLMYIFISAIIFLPFTLLGFLPSEMLTIFGYIFVLGIGGCLAGWFILPPVFFSDIAEDDEKQSGELRAGIYRGFPSILLNIFQSIGLTIMGLLMMLPKITVGANTFSIGYILWGPMSSLIIFLAYLYARKYIQLDFEWEEKRSRVK